MVRRGFLFAFILTLGALAGAAIGPSAWAQSIETRAREAILIDASTGTVLLERNADQRMPTASMSKVMTMYMVFEALDEGRLSLDDMLPVSEYAWRTGGSKMFVEVGTSVSVEDLIRGVVVQSGNDASIVLAEGLAGSEAEFGRRMTERARDLGMTGSNFTNATGLPDPDHYSTPRDLAILAMTLIERYPEYYHYYAEPEFTYHGITQQNRNPLLTAGIGADGLKTGHTEEAGYGLIGTAIRDGRRLVLVVGGLDSMRARAEESLRLMEWGFREFDTVQLFQADEAVAEARVWMGEAASVPLVAGRAVVATMPRAARQGMRVVALVEEPVPAPILRGSRLGTLRIEAEGQPPHDVPLFAGADVAEAGLPGRILTNLQTLITGAE